MGVLVHVAEGEFDRKVRSLTSILHSHTHIHTPLLHPLNTDAQL